VKVNAKPGTTNVASNYLQARSQAQNPGSAITIKPFEAEKIITSEILTPLITYHYYWG